MSMTERPEDLKSVVVTGVSSGIGQAIAERLIGRGVRVFGSVRREDDARRLAERFGPAFVPLQFDVLDESAIARAAAQVGEALDGVPLWGLINNAGMPGGGPLTHMPIEEIRQILLVNGLGPVIVAQAFVPLLEATDGRPAGRIINISSVGGRLVAPFIAAYQASKHALEAYSDGLRRELMIQGIDVVVIEPGAVRTPIWAKTQALDMTRYEGTPFAEPIRRFLAHAEDLERSGLPPEAIAEVVETALSQPQPKARYVVLKGRLRNWTIPRLLPDRWLDRLMAGAFGLRANRG